ncbi:hypothetical protein P8452_14519 [Trifolium repens]|nr:hypothetical protein P8452_14519 [Trifolium repens]
MCNEVYLLSQSESSSSLIFLLLVVSISILSSTCGIIPSSLCNRLLDTLHWCFHGEIDAYWWVLCTEKYFKYWRTPETYKMIVAGLAMKGPPLTWWLRWYPRHSSVNWDAFTSIFL